MRRRHLAFGIGIVLVITVWSGVAAVSWATPPPNQDATTELLKRVDSADSSRIGGDIEAATQLWNRRAEISRDAALAAIHDDTHSMAARELMVDVLSADSGSHSADDTARDLINDRSLPESIRARVVTRYEFGPSDANLLKSLVQSGSDVLAFHAMKKLGDASPSEAIVLARDALRGSSDSMRLSAAYKTLSRVDLARHDPKLVALLTTHIKEAVCGQTASAELADAAAVALVDLGTVDALGQLIDCKGVDPIMVRGAIDERASALVEALKGPPDRHVVETTMKAMAIYPVQDLAEPLRAAASRLGDASLLVQAEATANAIRQRGVPMNPKSGRD